MIMRFDPVEALSMVTVLYMGLSNPTITQANYRTLINSG